MRIGVIGSGNVGMALSRGFAAGGHEVMLGTRDPGKKVVTAWLEGAGPAASARGVREAAEFGEVVVLAVPGSRLAEVVDHIGADAFADKIVLDPTNPIDPTVHCPEPVFPGSSATEFLQASLPGARVVKALNLVGPDRMLDPDLSHGPRTMRIAGDDPDAKRVIGELLESYGWTIDDLGDATHARELEARTLEWMRKRFKGE